MDALDMKALEAVVNDFKLIFAIAFALAFNIITDDDLEFLKETEERINAAYEKYGADVVDTAVEMSLKSTFSRNLNRRQPDLCSICACEGYTFGKGKDDERN